MAQEFAGIFQKHEIFRVHARGYVLQILLPDGITCGLISYDGTRLRHLCAADPSDFEETLRAENRPLTEADPEKLGSLFCQVFLDRHGRSHHLIPDVDHLVNYNFQLPRKIELGYRVDEQALAQVADRIRPPSIVSRVPNGWRLEFTTIYGWQYEKHELGVEAFEIDEHFNIERTGRRILSERIFASVPSLRF